MIKPASPMKPQEIRAYLSGGDRRSLGRAGELVRKLESQPARLPELIREMWNPDAVIAMRAADAIEKLTRKEADILQRFKEELLGLAQETAQHELRWHLALMIPRLALRPAEQRKAAAILIGYLTDKSSIVKTHALQGLFNLSTNHEELRPQVEDLLRAASHSGTAAMRARARKLLAQMKKAGQDDARP